MGFEKTNCIIKAYIWYDWLYEIQDVIPECPTKNGASFNNPGEKDLMAVGKKAGLKPGKCAEIIDEIQECVFAELAEWL